MARETKVLYSLSDIQSVRFTCGNCGAVQSFPSQKWIAPPRACSNDAAHDWMQPGSDAFKMVGQLMESLRELSKRKGNGTSAFKVQLEFELQPDDLKSENAATSRDIKK